MSARFLPEGMACREEQVEIAKRVLKELGRDVAVAFHNTDCESQSLAGAWQRIVEFLSCGSCTGTSVGIHQNSCAG